MTYSVSNNAKKAMKTITNMEQYIRNSNTVRYNVTPLRSFTETANTVQMAYLFDHAAYSSLIKIWGYIEDTANHINKAGSLIKKYQRTPTNNRNANLIKELEKERKHLMDDVYLVGERLVDDSIHEQDAYVSITEHKDILLALKSFREIQETVIELAYTIDFEIGHDEYQPYLNYERHNSGNSENNAMQKTGFEAVRDIRAAVMKFITSRTVPTDVRTLSRYTKDSESKIFKVRLFVINERRQLTMILRLWGAVYESSIVINDILKFIKRARGSNNGLNPLRGVAEAQMARLKDESVAIDGVRQTIKYMLQANGDLDTQSFTDPRAKHAFSAFKKVEQLLVDVGEKLVDTFA